jgi:hypothetical protein
MGLGGLTSFFPNRETRTVADSSRRRRRTHCHDQNIRIIDFHWPGLTEGIPTKTAPAPLFRRRHQPALHRIAMDVTKLLNPLALCPNIEIIKPRLPESFRVRWGAEGRGAPSLAAFARPGSDNAPIRTRQTANQPKLECLYRDRQRLPLRFAHQ